MPPELSIAPIEAPRDIVEMRAMFREYEAFLNVGFCFPGFERELAGLPGEYAPPQGALFKATVASRVAGCVALRPVQDGVCEMKRLFVRPDYRGLGLGRKLAERIVLEAKRIGYARMRLDTFEFLSGAIHIYKDLGFTQIGSYYDDPRTEVLYWELDLQGT